MKFRWTVLIFFILLAGYTESCKNLTTDSTVSDLGAYAESGLKIATGTQAELGKNLVLALQDYGTEGAIGFCNANAILITDSMGGIFNAKIKRVSDQPRNMNNQANKPELRYILDAKNKLEAGVEVKPSVYELEGVVISYHPIITNTMCLQCHGIPGMDISSGTLARLNQIYPGDKATGYGVNQLRGIWVVTMDKEK